MSKTTCENCGIDYDKEDWSFKCPSCGLEIPEDWQPLNVSVKKEGMMDEEYTDKSTLNIHRDLVEKRDAQGRELHCSWFATDWLSNHEWIFMSNCGVYVPLTRTEKLFKHIYKEGWHPCPKCGLKMTVAKEMD